MPINGTVQATGEFAPSASGDTYAILDAKYMRDGFRNVTSLSDLDLITTDRRIAGMVVGVSGGTAYYKLNPEPWTNTFSDWSTFSTGGGGLTADTYWISGSTGVSSIKANNSSGLNAFGNYSVAIGNGTIASGLTSYAEGYQTTALGDYSHAQGNGSMSIGDISHATGNLTVAGAKAYLADNISNGVVKINSSYGDVTASFSGELYINDSNFDGNFDTILTTVNSVVFSGGNTYVETTILDNSINTNNCYIFDLANPLGLNADIKVGNKSYSEGESSKAYGESSHAEGDGTLALGNQSHAEGLSTRALGLRSHAEGSQTTASGFASHASGRSSKAYGSTSHAEGFGTSAYGTYSHSEGFVTKAIGDGSHAEGNSTTASGQNSHTEGEQTTASGDSSHAEGVLSFANGYASHAEGSSTTANNDNSHAEGEATTASGYDSHAEGLLTIASGFASHSEGDRTTANGNWSHAGGRLSIANGFSSFVHGSASTVNGNYSIVLGANITGNTDNTTYVDKLNIKTIGSGTPVTNVAVDVNGNVVSGTTSSSFTGNTSGSCITDLYISNLHGCSPITIHDTLSILSNVKISGGTGEIDFYNQLGVAITADNSAYLLPYIWVDNGGVAGIFDDVGGNAVSVAQSYTSMYNNFGSVNVYNYGEPSSMFVKELSIYTGSTIIHDTNKISIGVENYTGPGSGDQFDTIKITSNQGIANITNPRNKRGVIISSRTSYIETGVTNTVILGGENIIATANSSVYTPDIIVDATKVIKSINGGGQLDLDAGGNAGNILLTTDNASENESGVYITPTEINLFTKAYDAGFFIGPTATEWWNQSPNVDDQKLDITIGSCRFLSARNITTGSTFNTNNAYATAVIFNASNATFNSGVTNSVILGGDGITASTNNTAYVDNLNIKTISSGTSVTNLGVDASGNVVSASTGVAKYSTTLVTPSGTNTITHNLGTTDISVTLWLVTTGDMTSAQITNRTTNSVDVVFSSAPGENVRVVILG